MQHLRNPARQSSNEAPISSNCMLLQKHLQRVEAAMLPHSCKSIKKWVIRASFVEPTSFLLLRYNWARKQKEEQQTLKRHAKNMVQRRFRAKMPQKSREKRLPAVTSTTCIPASSNEISSISHAVQEDYHTQNSAETEDAAILNTCTRPTKRRGSAAAILNTNMVMRRMTISCSHKTASDANWRIFSNFKVYNTLY